MERSTQAARTGGDAQANAAVLQQCSVKAAAGLLLSYIVSALTVSLSVR
jgi:hypothetical protein